MGFARPLARAETRRARMAAGDTRKPGNAGDVDADPPRIAYEEDDPASSHEKITTWYDTTVTLAGLRRSPHLFVVGGTHSVGMFVPVWDGMTLGRGLTCDVMVS